MRIAQGQLTAAACFAVTLGLGAPLATAGDALSACLAACDRAKLSETNRATCRLDCEQDAATDPELIRAQIAEARAARAPKPAAETATRPTPTSRLACKAHCAADRALSADDRATCGLACDMAEETGRAAGPVAAAQPVTTGNARPGPSAVVARHSFGLAPSGFLNMCLQTCHKGQGKRSATNRATCALTCENTASVVDLALMAAPTGWFTALPVTPWEAPPGTQPVAAEPVTRAPVAGADPPRPVITGPTCEAGRATCEGACARVHAGCERGCSKQKVETDRETCRLDCGDNLSLCTADCNGEHASCVNRRNR